MVSTAIFNPNPRIERMPLSNGQSCLVIDHALVEPERWVKFAVTQRDAFRNVDFNAYPGIYLLAPDEVVAALNDFFLRHIRNRFDARRMLSTHCRYSMVTLPPQSLRPYQCICHRDSQNVPPQQSIQASVLYLFKDENLGGTSFYEAARSDDEIALLSHEASILSSQAFAAKYAIQPGYMHESNRYFAKIGNVPGKWNRLIFYDGSILHSGDIVAPDKLSSDPLNGRLTLNGFFTCRRNAA